MRELWARLPRPARAAALWLLTGAGYVLVRELNGHALVGSETEIPWPGLGVAFVAGLLGGPVLATAPAVGGFVDWTLHGTSPAVAAALGASVYVAALVAYLVGRVAEPGHRESVRRFIVRFAGAAAAALVASACFASVVAISNTAVVAGPARGLVYGFVGNLAAIVVIAPFVLAWMQPDWRGPAGRLELAALGAGAIGLSAAIAAGALGRLGPTPYLLLCIVFWAATRAGRRGTSTVVVLIAVLTVSNSLHGHGPFVGATREATLLSLGLFLIVLGGSGLGFAALGAVSAAARDELAAREQRYRALADNATDLVSIVAADGTILYESPSSARIIGRSSVGTHVGVHVHPEDVPRCREAFAQVLRSDEPVAFSFRFRHEDGRWLHLSSTGQNLLHNPAVRGIVVNSRDVTERRAAEQRYQELVERLPLVTYVNGMTPQQPPRYISPQIEEMLGYPVEAWYANPRFAYTIIHPDDLPLVESADEEAAISFEYRMVAADGRTVWVLDHMVTIRDETGEPVAVQGFLVDITQQKLLEEQLRRAQRIEALGMLAGGVAHDFNNLLMAISGYTELAEAHVDDPARCRADLREVAATAGRASALTRQLLVFGRRHELEREVVDVNALVRGTEPLLARLVGEDIEIVTRLDPALGLVRGDSAQLTQVLLNLTVNARDAMPTGGMLTIATVDVELDGAPGGPPAGGYVSLTVSDTGHGMDAATREHVFEPFFTTKEVGEGSGLGLAMVHGIVEQSGGRITVDSRPGGGTTFRIVLPHTADAEPVEPRVERPAPGGRETVLLVEDEDVVRRVTADMLGRLGYSVVAARTPQEALDLDPCWDLLVTDVMMPGMKGPELASRLRRIHPDGAVLFISGYAGGAVPDVDAELLEKPFGLEELARAVRDALDARSAFAERLAG